MFGSSPDAEADFSTWAYSSSVSRKVMFRVFLISLLSFIFIFSVLLTFVSTLVYNVYAKSLSRCFQTSRHCIRGVTNVNAAAPKIGGGVSHFFRCAAPRNDWTNLALSLKVRELSALRRLDFDSRPGAIM